MRLKCLINLIGKGDWCAHDRNSAKAAICARATHHFPAHSLEVTHLPNACALHPQSRRARLVFSILSACSNLFNLL